MHWMRMTGVGAVGVEVSLSTAFSNSGVLQV